MRKRKSALILLLAAALALSGCGGGDEKPSAPDQTGEQTPNETARPQGKLAESVRARLDPYAEILAQAARKGGDSLAYTIPGDLLNQMALDAEATGTEAREGRWRFTLRQAGDYTYEATSWDALDQYGQGAGVTPDPADETPLDSQLTGDYAVTGGGLFSRERAYDAAEDLSGGTADFTDTLNGRTTGHEIFRFCVRGSELFFADAALDASVQADGTPAADSYLAAVGVLRPDGLEVVEYTLTGMDQLPDPASLNWSRFLLTVSPVSRFSLQKE